MELTVEELRKITQANYDLILNEVTFLHVQYSKNLQLEIIQTLSNLEEQHRE